MIDSSWTEGQTEEERGRERGAALVVVVVVAVEVVVVVAEANDRKDPSGVEGVEEGGWLPGNGQSTKRRALIS